MSQYQTSQLRTIYEIFMKTKIKPGDYTKEACFFPEEKERTRDLVLEFSKRSTTLLDSNNRFSVVIIDLCGKRAPFYSMIKENGKIGSGGFYIGVDLDVKIVKECKSLFCDNTSLFLNSKLGMLLCREDIPEVQSCQILILDSHYGTNKKNFYSGDIINSIDFAKKQKDKLGEFLLVVNLCHGRFSKESDIERYCKFLTEEVGRKITKDDFIFYRSKKEMMMWIAISFGF
jgi:hypothetical protein